MLHVRTHKGPTVQKARALALASLSFIALGATNFATYAELNAGRAEDRYYRAHFAVFDDLRIWAVFFMISGVVGLVCAIKRNFHIGFSALISMSSWWSGMFVASWLLTGYTRIIPSILIWALMSLFFYILSTWPEYPDNYGKEVKL
jgi:Trk-type K+ transport system membrane component